MNWLRNIFAGWFLLSLLVLSQAQAATVVWSDNFETNASSRWSSTGVWKIGSPTAGPVTNALGYRAYSGTNCASTQGYSPAGQDVRLVCTNYLHGSNTLLVPQAGLSPRLRFWHWFNFANALGYVEVSTNNGANWIQLSPTYLDLTGGGVWSRPSLDLSGYAGQYVQFAFHFTSGGSAGNGLGWFVDDVEVDDGAPTLNFPENFQAGVGDWSMDFGGWEIGKPTAGPGTALFGTNCAATKLSGSYANNLDTRLISPPFLVPAVGDPQLSFWQWYSFNNALGYVEINTGVVNGSTTTNVTITTNMVATMTNTIYQIYNATISGYGSPFYWNAVIGGWTNGTKVIGSVYDYYAETVGPYFEAGTAPLATMGTIPGDANVDYRADSLYPAPSPATLTNTAAMQGATWNIASGLPNNPVGYFATNVIYTYTTNIGTVFSQSSWTTISPIWENATSEGIWTNVSLDLSAYEGQVVEVAFHFTSGGSYTAPGWFVDNVSLSGTIVLTMPTNQAIYAGQTLPLSMSATNSVLPNAIYNFTLSPLSPAMLIANSSTTTAELEWTNTGLVNGILNWTNSSLAPGVYTISVVATDNSTPPQSTTGSFELTILPPPLPTLTGLTNQAIYAGQSFTLPVVATNSYLPNANYNFTLLPPSPALQVAKSGPNTSVLSWTNTGLVYGKLNWSNYEAGPVTYTISVVAADNSLSPLSATNSFELTISAPPLPQLIVPTNLSVYADQTPLIATNSATNTIVPTAQYTYQLQTNALSIYQTNATVSSNGVFTWFAPSAASNGMYTFTVIATDNSLPPLATNNSFVVTVTNPSQPTLFMPANQTLYAGQTMVVTNSAVNELYSGDTFSFSLVSPLLTNMDVSRLTNAGILKWAIPINQAAGTYTNIIQVIDNYSPGFPASGSFLVTVSNAPLPVLTLPGMQFSSAGGRLTISNIISATNSVFPGDSYRYSVTNSPVGVTMVATNGQLTWLIPNSNTSTNVAITVVVTDTNVPPLQTNGTFSVSVRPTPVPTLGTPAFTVNGGKNVSFSIYTPLATSPWMIVVTTNLSLPVTKWVPIYTNGASGPLSFTDQLSTNILQRYYRLLVP